ncbi:MAG: hypothetical protein QI223_01905 [Candidatus Korarchaeota archaeon]|nr:hypothetical protein [Candidatus Korarchaeota archaeon]
MEKKPLTLAEVRDLIFERWARDQSALTPDQRRLFEYLAKFTKVRDPKAARRAVEVLMSEYDLSEEDAIQLVNVLPKTPDELRPFLFRSYPLLDEKAYKGILEVLKGLEEAEAPAEAEVEAEEAVEAQSEAAAQAEGEEAQEGPEEGEDSE